MHQQPINAEQIRSLLAEADARGLSAKARERLGWLLHFAEHGFSVSDTCRFFGIPRMTFYRALHRFDSAHPESLEDQSRRPHSVRQSAASPEVIAFVQECRARFPQLGKDRIATLLQSSFGTAVSPSTVARILAKEPTANVESTTDNGQSGEISREPQPATSNQSFDTAQGRQRATSNDVSCHAPDCLLCRFHRVWRAWKRVLLIGSFVTNVALIGLFLASLLWRALPHDQQLRVSADLSSTVSDSAVSSSPSPLP